MTCPLCGHNEKAERCNWPMPDSPPCFFDGDELDRENLARRLNSPEFDRALLAELLHLEPRNVWTLVKRGQLPKPDHYEQTDGNGQDRAIWKAEQLVGLVVA